MPLILVVEDEPDIRQLVRDVLEHAGFDVIDAADGTTALHRARSNAPAWWSWTWACLGSTDSTDST